MKTYTIKRIWNGLASPRDYVVQACIDQQEDLLLVLENKPETMRISWQDLKSRSFQISTRKIKSKYGGPDYELIDFKWSPDPERTQPTLL